MKNIVVITAITVLFGFLTSCAKKDNIQAPSIAFYTSPFSAKCVLGTAD